MNMTKLKGGSLSSTFLCDNGHSKFIRKYVSLTENREYGYVRWYSQLKKMQRYSSLYYGLFPLVKNVSFENDQAYFDLEYMDGYRDIKSLLSDNGLTDNEIKQMSDTLWKAFNRLHDQILESNHGAPYLYYKEEVEQKIKDALTVPEFAEFYDYKEYIFHGRTVPGIHKYMEDLEKYFKYLNLTYEQTIHGNPTLENTLYSLKDNRIVFIDCYEESIIDTKYLDYAQVLQCSRSHYGYINDREVIVDCIDDNILDHRLIVPASFKKFNEHFESKIEHKKELVAVLEATQFIRMLPFKCLAGDLDKAKYFYVHACYLLKKVFDD